MSAPSPIFMLDNAKFIKIVQSKSEKKIISEILNTSDVTVSNYNDLSFADKSNFAVHYLGYLSKLNQAFKTFQKVFKMRAYVTTGLNNSSQI